MASLFDPVIVYGAELPFGQLLCAELLGRHYGVWAITSEGEPEERAFDLFNILSSGIPASTGNLIVDTWGPSSADPAGKTNVSWGKERFVDGQMEKFGSLVTIAPSILVASDWDIVGAVSHWAGDRLAESAITIMTRDGTPEENCRGLVQILRQIGLMPLPNQPLVWPREKGG